MIGTSEIAFQAFSKLVNYAKGDSLLVFEALVKLQPNPTEQKIMDYIDNAKSAAPDHELKPEGPITDQDELEKFLDAMIEEAKAPPSVGKALENIQSEIEFMLKTGKRLGEDKEGKTQNYDYGHFLCTSAWRLGRYLEALRTEREGWRHIRTAKTNGLTVQLWSDTQGWIPKGHYANGWGYMEFSENLSDYEFIEVNDVTHWRPLPAPPAATKAD